MSSHLTSIRRHPLLLTAGSGSCACRSLKPRAEDYRANHKVEMAIRLAYCPNLTVGQTSHELTRRTCQAESFSGECSYSLSVVVPSGIMSTTTTCMVLGSSSSRSPLAGYNLQYRPSHCVLIDHIWSCLATLPCRVIALVDHHILHGVPGLATVLTHIGQQYYLRCKSGGYFEAVLNS